MILGCCGAGGTGKSTMVELIAKEYNLKVPVSISRQYYRERGITEEQQSRFSPKDRWEAQKSMFDMKLDRDCKEDNFFADRTLLDHLAYCLIYCSSEISDTLVLSMEALVKSNAQRYNKIFYFPMVKWSSQDEVRNTHYAHQVLVDSVMTGLAKKLNIHMITVPPASIEARRDVMVEELNSSL